MIGGLGDEILFPRTNSFERPNLRCYVTSAKGCMVPGPYQVSQTEPLGYQANSQCNLPCIHAGGAMGVKLPFPYTRGNHMELKNKPEHQTQEDPTSDSSESSNMNFLEALVSQADRSQSVGDNSTAENPTAGMSKTGLQRKKLSGAVKRKLKRAKKIAEGTWTETKPPKKGYRSKADSSR